MTKPRLTLDEHAAIGGALASMRDEILHLSTQVANAYPKTGAEGRAAKELGAAVNALDSARAELDNAAAREHPDSFEPTIYYPHPEDRQRRR